tara:strand:- start:29408 stop:29722 length:315 start_codon:yes stop_codon:yes gene_type:complete
MELIHFILITAGASYGITKSDLFLSIRSRIHSVYMQKNAIEIKNTKWWFIYHVSSCPFCMGFYVSIPVYLLIFKKFDLLLIGYMFIGSITSHLIYLLINKLKQC